MITKILYREIRSSLDKADDQSTHKDKKKDRQKSVLDLSVYHLKKTKTL